MSKKNVNIWKRTVSKTIALFSRKKPQDEGDLSIKKFLDRCSKNLELAETLKPIVPEKEAKETGKTISELIKELNELQNVTLVDEERAEELVKERLDLLNIIELTLRIFDIKINYDIEYVIEELQKAKTVEEAKKISVENRETIKLALDYYSGNVLKLLYELDILNELDSAEEAKKYYEGYKEERLHFFRSVKENYLDEY